MNWGVFWRALVVQAAAVALLSVVLIALPLPKSFFGDFGFIAGPGAWALCAAITARVLRLPVLAVLGVALAAGLVALGLTLAGVHWAGVAVGLLAFAAGCSLLIPPGRLELPLRG